ncbi:MAG: permease [Candidatus Omnitrophica bacterium]|nr:permease [Candidatus Omnitrophota bacterium]
MLDNKLIQIVDIFRCCIFTWGALTTVLPAFLLSGAIATFSSTAVVTKYLGPKANKWLSYPIAAIIGKVLPVCSCNIVPLFASILKRGCGIGPAFCLLYAAPAVSIISLAFTFKVIGPLLALWRLVGVLIISISIGLIMSVLFKDKPCSTEDAATGVVNSEEAVEKPKNKFAFMSFFVILFLILIVGSTVGGIDPLRTKDIFMWHKICLMALLAMTLMIILLKCFPKESTLSWLDAVWRLLKSILPLLIPAIFLIGLLSSYIDIRWVHNLFSAQKDALGHRLFFSTVRSTFLATLFGELMYFPVLTEVVFTKAFLKLGMDIGPAMGLLLSGPGTSLPGFLLIYKFTGAKKVLAYFSLSLIMETVFAVILSMYIGDYLCACLIP